MTNYVVGIDPDCKKSGIAVYEDGVLTGLMNLSISDYVKALPELARDNAVIAIENAALNKFIYSRNTRSSPSLAAKIAQDIGGVKRQGQIMIELAKSLGIKVVEYKPSSTNWQRSSPKKGDNEKSKERLLNLTGWDGPSNPETRSAAYFGHKYCQNKQ